MDASVATLHHLAEKLNAECVELRRRQEHHGYIADLLIRQRADERDFTEVRLLIHRVHCRLYFEVCEAEWLIHSNVRD